VNSYAYDPFGQILSQQETAPQPFKYVGQYGVMAEPNGLYYMKARYYDSSVGRFISQDPIGFAGGDLSLYGYVLNNPINRIDPIGLTDEPTDGEAPIHLPQIMGGGGGELGGGEPLLPELIGSAGELDIGEAGRPPIKPGSAYGPTAGRPFPESVRNAAKAENPTATCVYCGRRGTATQVDHAIPKACGGDATLDNAQLTCPHCNASKGAGDFPKTPPYGYRGPWPP
jgi:RHS repeat-associated protein